MHQKLRRNYPNSADPIISHIAATTMSKENCIRSVLERIEPVFQDKYGNSFKESVADTVGKEDQTKIVSDVFTVVKSSITEVTNMAVLANNVSYRTMSNLRRDITLVKSDKQQRPRHPIKHDLFVFDRELVKKHLADFNEKMVWTDLARHFPVTQQNGKPALNAPQVLKSFAIDNGLCEQPINLPQKRRVARKLTIGDSQISMKNFLPNDQELKEVTKEKIISGDIDIGSPIVPISLRTRSIGKDGQLTVHDTVLHGRKFSLQSIMDRSLKEQEELGLLRVTYPEDHDLAVALQELQEKGKQGWLLL